MSMQGSWSLNLKSFLKYFTLLVCTLGLALGGAQAGAQPALRTLISSSIGHLALVEAAEPRASGRQLRLNGRLITGEWQMLQNQIGIADGAIATHLGIDLISTNDATRQPVTWFLPPNQGPQTIAAWYGQNNRYLDIAPIARQQGWQVTPQDSVLDLTLPSSQIAKVRQGHQSWGDRLVLDLTQSTAWQVSPGPNDITITIEATMNQGAIARFKPQPTDSLKSVSISSSGKRTTFTLTVGDYFQAHTWSLAQPNRLIIDIRPDPLKPKDIQWADGIQWQQRYVSVNTDRFPIYALTLDPAQTKLLPLMASSNQATGIKPPTALADQWQTAAMINGGFFNRNNQLPLGAVRTNNRWISGPILGRGAVGWNDQGDVIMDRLVLNTAVNTSSKTFPIDMLNSGYVKAGIARYTGAWGSTYTTLTDHETVITVNNSQVVQQQTFTTAGQDTINIPSGGYLLILRALSSARGDFAPGTTITLNQQSQPSRFDQLPHTLGAGPLLMTQGKIVLNAEREGFSRNFIEGRAPRSVFGLTPSGKIKLVTVQNRVGGRGPTLKETAFIMQKLGCTEALNLDGGSSSSLYLNGQLLNRHPRTAARINNGLGVFLNALP